MPITTAMADSFKVELLQGAHCFNAQIFPTASSASSTAYTAVSSMAGVAVGMTLTGASTGASSVIAAITGTSTFTASVASTGTTTTQPITVTGDIFKMALIKATATSYTNLTSNYSAIGADEVSNGSGYVTLGAPLTNVTAVANGSPAQAVINFNPNPSWTSASFSTIGCMIYNSAARMGGTTQAITTGRACGVFDFGGTQTVANGTFTVVMPAASSAAAILRVA